MYWIQSPHDLARHPQTRRLAKALACSVPQAVGHLHILWNWALDFAEDGNLSSFDADELAEAALWDGDSTTFVAALVSTGFLVDGGHIWEWENIGEPLVKKRQANAERQRAFRAKQQGGAIRHSDGPPADPSGDMSHNGYVTVTSPLRNAHVTPKEEKRREEIRKEENTSTPLPPAHAGGRAAPKATVGGSSYQAMFTAIAARWGVSNLPWTFGHEGQAVKRLLDSEPRASPTDIPPFLDYLRSTWPYVTETTRLPKPSDKHAADHWPAWWQLGCPTEPLEGGTPRGQQDHRVTPAERTESAWAAHFAPVDDSAEPDHGGRRRAAGGPPDARRPPALPARVG